MPGDHSCCREGFRDSGSSVKGAGGGAVGSGGGVEADLCLCSLAQEDLPNPASHFKCKRMK